MYLRITSTGAPPVVSRQKLRLQKYSFQSLRLIPGNSCFNRRLLALLYALMRFLARKPGISMPG